MIMMISQPTLHSYDNASHSQEQLGNEVSVLLFLINNFMTNIEKVKRIIDAGHWVKVTYPDGVTRIITSYYKDLLSYIRTDMDIMVVLNTPDFKDCTIEVIQRIPTAYKA